MSISRTIIWIDDNPARKTTADDLGAKFVDVHEKDLAQEVDKLIKGPQPSLVILDHILDKTATKNPLFQRGSTIAEAIKEHWPACPVIGVTNEDNDKDIDIRTRRTYDALYQFLNLGKYLPRIKSISRDFAAVKKAKAKKTRDIVKLLKPPEDEIERLVAALPDDLKESFRDASLASRLFRWVGHLIDRPGFLYNSLWAATFLGLNESGFKKVIECFEKGKYVGVFACGDDPRWWSSRLSELLYKLCKPEIGELSWDVGRRLSGIKKENYSRCYVCDEEFPDTVAYLDAVSDECRAMHMKCTMLHPRYKRELYFEDIRMMQGK